MCSPSELDEVASSLSPGMTTRRLLQTLKRGFLDSFSYRKAPASGMASSLLHSTYPSGAQDIQDGQRQICRAG
jgi:hypothetical protein